MKTNVKFSFGAEFHDVMSAQFHFISFMFQVRKMAPSTSGKVHLPPHKLFLLFFHNGIKLHHFFQTWCQ